MALGLNQYIQWMLEGSISGRKDDHSPPSAMVNNKWRYTSTPPYVFKACPLPYCSTDQEISCLYVFSKTLYWALSIARVPNFTSDFSKINFDILPSTRTFVTLNGIFSWDFPTNMLYPLPKLNVHHPWHNHHKNGIARQRHKYAYHKRDSYPGAQASLKI
jgi:hypothetical protein